MAVLSGKVLEYGKSELSALPAEHPSHSWLRWLSNQPYLLLSLTSLFWAGNIVLGRYVAGHVPPMTLSCVRWIGAFLMLWPFARSQFKHDWPALRARWPLMLLLSANGFAINNALSYWALQYTQSCCSANSRGCFTWSAMRWCSRAW